MYGSYGHFGETAGERKETSRSLAAAIDAVVNSSNPIAPAYWDQMNQVFPLWAATLPGSSSAASKARAGLSSRNFGKPLAGRQGGAIKAFAIWVRNNPLKVYPALFGKTEAPTKTATAEVQQRMQQVAQAQMLAKAATVPSEPLYKPAATGPSLIDPAPMPPMAPGDYNPMTAATSPRVAPASGSMTKPLLGLALVAGLLYTFAGR